MNPLSGDLDPAPDAGATLPLDEPFVHHRLTAVLFPAPPAALSVAAARHFSIVNAHISRPLRFT